MTQDPAPTAQLLSPRETEVLPLLAEGQPNKVIAQVLNIGVATVERHVASIYRKVGARGRADAALHAASVGLVPLPAPEVRVIPPGAFGFSAMCAGRFGVRRRYGRLDDAVRAAARPVRRH